MRVALVLLSAALAAAPAGASNEADRLSAYVSARAANLAGDPGTAARLFAELVRQQPANPALRERAVVGAIEAGNMRLALDLGRGIGFERAPLELRMLMVAEEIRTGRSNEAIALLQSKSGLLDSTFLLPFVEAWARAARRDRDAVSSLARVTEQSALSKQVDEHRAMILLALGRAAEARPFADKALADAGGRADRLRLAFADGFRAAGDRAGAEAMLAGGGSALALGRARLASGKPLGQAVDTPVKAFGELMLGLAVALNRLDDKSLSVALGQVARYANPDNGAARLLLGLLLDDSGRTGDALQMLRSIDLGDPFASQSEDAEIRILIGAKRQPEALARAQQIAATVPSADAYSRLGAVLTDMNRDAEAADAYGRAITLARTGVASDQMWTLHLFRAGALEDSGRWEESKAEIAAAMALSPDNALLLNFLGYGKLERGEDLDSAEAMVRKASALKPDDASITDSLGWAQFKRGKVDEAIATLQRAADGDPGQSEIREHLGDALYTAGRRIEARFAWRAALVTADEDDARKRIESKLASGLSPANAAP
jgi:tetratricopeptide (TPR) repeat protein